MVNLHELSLLYLDKTQYKSVLSEVRYPNTLFDVEIHVHQAFIFLHWTNKLFFMLIKAFSDF